MYSAEEASQLWNNPRFLKQIEEGRYPYQRALKKIISNTFQANVPEEAEIYEVGAGTGYLKDLVPSVYHPKYTSTDYNLANLREGQKRRQLQTLRADAYALPFETGSVDCVVDMDAYDTLLNLGNALGEATRVLKPGGTYIHFQVNSPSDDTVWVDNPELIFLPTKGGPRSTRRVDMIGVTRQNLEEVCKSVPHYGMRVLLEEFLDDPTEAYVTARTGSRSSEIASLIMKFMDMMPIDTVRVPSLPEYFKNKLERLVLESGLDTVDSNFRATSVIGDRSPVQRAYPQFNQFGIEQGEAHREVNEILARTNPSQIVEKASILTFVARKPK